MKIIDLQLYRSRRAIQELEQRIGALATSHELGTASKLKTCFREWLQKTNSA